MLNLNNLTVEELRKLNKIADILSEEKEPMIQETFDIFEMINFIRYYYSTKKYKFYPDTWYLSNLKRTRAIYYKAREEYVAEYQADVADLNKTLHSAKLLLDKVIA